MELDNHWRPQVMLCHPCRYNYSYVIKFENIEAESNRLLEFIQRNDNSLPQKVVFPNTIKSSTSNSRTLQTIQQTPEEMVQQLREIYKDDFSFYDYDPFKYRGS